MKTEIYSILFENYVLENKKIFIRKGYLVLTPSPEYGKFNKNFYEEMFSSLTADCLNLDTRFQKFFSIKPSKIKEKNFVKDSEFLFLQLRVNINFTAYQH